MKITIHDVDHLSDLVSAIEALTRSAREQSDTFFAQAEQVFSRQSDPAHDVPTVEETAAVVGLDLVDYAALAEILAGESTQHELPLPAGEWAKPGPLRYVPCPQAGQHARLTDCWMCWSDAHVDAFGRR